MNNKVRILLSCVLWGVTTLAGAVEYIQPQPFMISLKDTARVGNVRSGAVELPIISWGADIATIYANGNGANTAAASLFGQAGLDFKLVREDVFARQIEKYMSGQTPYLRGTMGMINMEIGRAHV